VKFPNELRKGSVIGIFTPSTPANVIFREKYLHGISQLSKLGFKVIEGYLTKQCAFDNYRTGSAKERAKEFMLLVEDPNVDALIATVGGYNTSSILPYLDYDKIRFSQKSIIGYSDITSLHMAILKKAKLATFYGPNVFSTFGEWPEPLDYTLDLFIKTLCSRKEDRELQPPSKTSNTFRDASTNDWKELPREYQENIGWIPVKKGISVGHCIIANLETLLALSGTEYFPNLKDKILFVEDMNTTLALQERSMIQLKLMGGLASLKGLIISKPESIDLDYHLEKWKKLILEIMEDIEIPIIMNFDCGHTHPMITLQQMSFVEMKVGEDSCKVKIIGNPSKY